MREVGTLCVLREHGLASLGLRLAKKLVLLIPNNESHVAVEKTSLGVSLPNQTLLFQTVITPQKLERR